MRGTIVRLKLGDIKAKAKQLKNKRLKHLERFLTTLDPDDALEFCGRSAPRSPIFPHWWLNYNTSRSKIRFKKKSLHYLQVIISLNAYGYDPELFHSGHMKLTKMKTLIDGNHRFDLLYAKHGPEFEADFLMVGVVQTIMVTVITTFIISLYTVMFTSLILIQLISIPYYILNKLFNFVVRIVSKE